MADLSYYRGYRTFTEFFLGRWFDANGVYNRNYMPPPNANERVAEDIVEGRISPAILQQAFNRDPNFRRYVEIEINKLLDKKKENIPGRANGLGRSRPAITWIQHVKKYQSEHAGMSYREALVAAKPSWQALKKKPAAQSGKGIIDKIKKIAKAVKYVFFFPPNRLPGNSQRVFDKYKDAVIQSITVNRAPIYSIVDRALNLMSLGRWDKAKRQLGYDQMFHLSMVLHTNKGNITIEKNERVNIEARGPKEGEKVSIANVPNITLDAFLEKARKSMGDHRFFQYNAFENNCQDFLVGILSANGILDSGTRAFIKQDAEALLKQMPGYISKIAQGATDAAGKITQVLTGQGKRKKPRVSSTRPRPSGRRH